jgi:putative sugar O-methyltransferase
MTGIYKDWQSTVDQLLKSADEDQDATSSHWKKMHRFFDFKDGEFSGLYGFGDLTLPHTGLTYLAHRLLQKPYRSVGKEHRRFQDIDRLAETICERQNRFYNLDLLRQSLTLAWLTSKLDEGFWDDQIILVIGDGFGSFTSLLLATFPKSRVISVNLSKTLLVDLAYIKIGLPEINPVLVTNKEGMTLALADLNYRLLALSASNNNLIQGLKISLAVNIASMQEMNKAIIQQYFNLIRTSKSPETYFYCCNREEKILPDGSVTRFDEYSWLKDDIILEDEVPLRHKKYYTLRPPFYKNYDGLHRHRLTKLALTSPTEQSLKKKT